MAKEREERPWKDESDLRCVLMKTKTAQRERESKALKFFCLFLKIRVLNFRDTEFCCERWLNPK